jgi:magnesium transporter
MDAVQTGKPPERQTHVTFETAAEHATSRVPVAGRFQRVGDVREHLIGQRYESASHIVVCEADTFLGIVTIEELLFASADAKMESLMDREASIVAPAVDQEVAAWRAVRHGESALAVVDGHGHFVGMIPPHRLLGVLLSEHEEDLARSAGFLKTTSVARTASEEPVHRASGIGSRGCSWDSEGLYWPQTWSVRSKPTCSSTSCSPSSSQASSTWPTP